jgi:hypothetical protein
LKEKKPSKHGGKEEAEEGKVSKDTEKVIAAALKVHSTIDKKPDVYCE